MKYLFVLLCCTRTLSCQCGSQPWNSWMMGGRKDLGPRDHERSLEALCACCGRKRNLRDVTDVIASLIRQFAVPSYTLGSSHCPKKVCSTCVSTLYEFRKNPQQTSRKFPPLLEYESLFQRSSRSSGSHLIVQPGVPCPCKLCDLVRSNLDYEVWHQQHSRPTGRPRDDPPEPVVPLILCPQCYSPYGPGKTHKCSVATKEQNLVSRVEENSKNTTERVTSKLLKDITNQQGVSKHGGIAELQSGGSKKYRVRCGTNRGRGARGDFQINHKDFFHLQRQMDISDSMVLQIKSFLSMIHGQNSVEPYLKAALTSRNKDLQDFFTVPRVTFKKTSGKKEEYVHQPVIVAEIPALITYLLNHRGLDPDHHQVQLGIDGGQNVLKFCLLAYQVVEGQQQEPSRKRAKHLDGVRSRGAKLTSVKERFQL